MKSAADWIFTKGGTVGAFRKAFQSRSEGLGTEA